jgi:hypothetical protein
VSTPPRSDPDAPGETDQPASPAETPADREPFEFVERPRVKGEI